MPTTHTTRAIIYLLLSQMLYGAGFSIAKDLMPAHLPPFGFIVVRVLGALLLFGIHHRFFAFEKIKTAHIPKFVLCGLCGAGANMLLFFKGVALTSPVNGALMMLITPVLVAVVAYFILNETLTKLNIIGICISMGGALALILWGKTQNPTQVSGNWLGDVYVLLNAIIYAFYLIIIKPLTKTYNPITITFYTFVFGTLVVLPFGFTQFLGIEWHRFDVAIWLKIIFIVVGITYLTYLFNALAIKQLKSSVVGSFIYLQPFMASLFAYFWRNDTIKSTQVFLGAVIMLGVYLVSRRKAQS